MAFDVKKWLMEEMGFGEAEATDYASKMKPDAVSKIEATHSRTTKILASEAEIVKTQAALKDANDKLNAEMVEWAGLSAKEKATATELQASLEAAKTRAVQLETRLTKLATDHGVDPKTLLDGTATIPVKKEEPAAVIDPTKYASVENFQAMSAFMLDLPFKLHQIADEHLALTGQRLDTGPIREEILARAGKKGAIVDPVAIWEEKHGIPEKRAAKIKADFDAQIKAAEDRGEERGRSDAALPGPSVPGRHAPVFGNRGQDGQIQPRVSLLKRPQPETGLRGAAAALASGKYRKTG